MDHAEASFNMYGTTVTGNRCYLEFTVPKDGKNYWACIYSTPLGITPTSPLNFNDVFVAKLNY